MTDPVLIAMLISAQHCTAPPHLISKMAQVVISKISEQHQVGKIYELFKTLYLQQYSTPPIHQIL